MRPSAKAPFQFLALVLALVPVMVVVAVASPRRATAFELKVEDWAWAWQIDPDQVIPKNRLKNPTRTKSPPLYIWFKISGGIDALEYMKATKSHITILTKWQHVVGGILSSTESKKITIGRTSKHKFQTVLNILEEQVRKNGFFVWQTFARWDDVRRATYGVQLHYVDGFQDPILCEGSPCRYEIGLD
ncbi:MAG: hypothetical protein O7I42_22045 [Alphaproteobacteria bacterium]|nr:hypothetical protein [Alphaproteobacteria bacterium]